MSPEELKLKRIKLREQFDKDMRELGRRYALAHNKVKPGDIVIDHNKRVKVEKTGVYNAHTNPECYYEGIALQADLKKPMKNQRDNRVYQSNITRIIPQNEQ